MEEKSGCGGSLEFVVSHSWGGSIGCSQKPGIPGHGQGQSSGLGGWLQESWGGGWKRWGLDYLAFTHLSSNLKAQGVLLARIFSPFSSPMEDLPRLILDPLPHSPL